MSNENRFSIGKFFLRLFIFWLAFFFIFRMFFLFSQLSAIKEFDFFQFFKLIYKSLQLDVSTTCYFCGFLVLLLTGSTFYKSSVWRKVSVYYHGLMIFFSVGLSLANINVYGEWGTLLNARAISYITQPKEVFASVSTLQMLVSVLIWITLFLFFFWIFRKHVNKFFPELHTVRWFPLGQLIIAPVLIFIGLRGGTQLIPINESAAYFSSTPVLNHVATNNIWYLGHNIIQSQITGENPYTFYDNQTAAKIVNSLYETNKDSTLKVFNFTDTVKPNVVIIILESWSADVVDEKNVTPSFNKLKKEGLYFDNVYSSGFRTDQGIVSVLSGFPAQPNNSIIRHPEKTEKLPSLIRTFKNKDYKTSFYYGGEIGFANMNSYFLNSGCDKLITKNDFKNSSMSNKWGAYDEFVLSKHIEGLKTEQQPFFSILLTLSTHEPFDIPVKNPFEDGTEPNLFRGAAWYTDQCLGNYFENAEKQPWFSNTIFILLADHGHRLPKEHAFEDPLARRMTFLMYGNLLKPEMHGKTIHSIINQNDLAATLLAQLDLPHNEFKWSNNIFGTNRKDFAYISLDFGFSWLSPNGHFVYHFDSEKFDLPSGNENISTADTTNGKAYMQCLYRQYLSY